MLTTFDWILLIVGILLILYVVNMLAYIFIDPYLDAYDRRPSDPPLGFMVTLIIRDIKKTRKEKKADKIRGLSYQSIEEPLDSKDILPYNKNMEQKYKKIKYIALAVVLLLVSIIIPVIVDNCIIGNLVPSNISNDQWVTFLGSYIGGIFGGVLAIVGVYFTLRHYKKQEEQDRHTAVKPVLDAWHINGSCLHGINDASRYFDYVFNEKFTHWINFAKRENIDEADWIHFELMIRNIGMGPAVGMKISLDTGNAQSDGTDQQIGIPRDSAIAYHMYIPKKALSPEDSKLVFTFTDVYQSKFFKQEMTLDLSSNPDGVEYLRDIGALTLPEPLERKDK